MLQIRPSPPDKNRPHDRAMVHRVGYMLAGVGMLTLLGGIGLIGAGAREQVRSASQRALRVAELRGTIARLDEFLVMTTRMAAMSGERRWAERFEEAAPKLDAALAEANDIATSEIRTALAETAGEAHRDLVTMERRALSLAAASDLAPARALLDSPEFDYLQEVYADGVDVFGQDLKTLADAHAADLDARAWSEAGGLGLIAVLLVSTALALRGRQRLRDARARTAVVARTDLLTNLPNRGHFHENAAEEISAGQRVGIDHALLLIDLDRFKAINDAHGHLAGDELLQIASVRLRSVLQDERRIARLGGDEFACLLRCEPADADRPRTDPGVVAARIVEVLSEPVTLSNGVVVESGASVGIGLTRAGDTDLEDLMHRADVALYRAKADGRGCFRFFEQGADARVRAQALLESDFRRAVIDDAIVPHFQPLVDIKTGRLVGVEMLARWPHSTRGMVSPAEFIPIAENTGLIGTMTVNLLRRGCRAAAAWPEHIMLACNISPLQLRDVGLPATIAAVLAETGFPASRLEIEVTESALVGDLGLARALLNELKALGASLALDDFGTGYSSLRHLQLLPFDKLKIDQSFVGVMPADCESAKIVSAVVGLGHSLGLMTVAEGVETEEVSMQLRALGCDIGQGWLFGRPVPACTIDALIAEQAATLGSNLSLVA